ncbi:MAG: IS66 family transposase [Planctomycetaceae bacterium]|nr:IS66 family transposase [Planctomycetaceae bacterium]
MESLLGTDFSGTISCDFWGAYKKFERMTSATLQLCWSHFVRNEEKRGRYAKS